MCSARMRLENLLPSTNYKLSLIAKSTTGLESIANIYSVTTAPDPPDEFRAKKLTSSSAVLSWIKPLSRVKSYSLRLIHGGKTETRILNATKSSETLHKLEPATHYQARFKIRLKKN